jgi:regulator of protease activity HflC (stomatin/prohibitin superfamily)
MSGSRITRGDDGGGIPVAVLAPNRRWPRRALLVAVPVVAALVLLTVLWKLFVRYVPPGNHLVVISKSGTPLDPTKGEVLADEGQKGIQKAVRGEGYHFVWPIVYATEVHPNTVVKPGWVGIVTAQGGVPPRDGRVLAEQDDEQGIRRAVLLPGTYRLNAYGYLVEQVKMVEIKPGFVGVKRRLLGVDGPSQFATKPTEKGIIKDEVLQPGLYPINTKEFQVLECDVGVYQTTYTFRKPSDRAGKSTALTFYGQGGAQIRLDCTIEWELKPEFWPTWLTRFKDHREIEAKVIDLHCKQIAQVRGSRYAAQDFLDGLTREKFQEDFRKELNLACEKENVIVRSAFIRNIAIPEAFLSEKRDQRLAVEKALTSQELEVTAETENLVAKAKRQIEAKEAEVKAETARMIATIERETENVKALNEAEIEKLKAEYGAKIAELDAQRTEETGKAEAESLKLKETAKSSLYKMKMDVFRQDGDAYLRYTLAKELNPDMKLRLYHSGPGTLWTNMGNKNMSFMLPMPNSEKEKEKTSEKEK